LRPFIFEKSYSFFISFLQYILSFPSFIIIGQVNLGRFILKKNA
jgi:hypothetical protein